MEKKTFFQNGKKRERLTGKITRTTQQPPLLPEEVTHVAPMDILGTSGMGKARVRTPVVFIPVA